jgi:hypothetical protein
LNKRAFSGRKREGVSPSVRVTTAFPPMCRKARLCDRLDVSADVPPLAVVEMNSTEPDESTLAVRVRVLPEPLLTWSRRPRLPKARSRKRCGSGVRSFKGASRPGS